MFKVLWLDNDPEQTTPYVSALKRRGYLVDIAMTIEDFERRLTNNMADAKYQLVILDVMVPTKDAIEEDRYPPERTARGLETGLAIWDTWKDRLRTVGTKVLVLTVRLDREIRDKFIKSGLSQESFSTKMDLRDTDEFLKRIDQIITSS